MPSRIVSAIGQQGSTSPMMCPGEHLDPTKTSGAQIPPKRRFTEPLVPQRAEMRDRRIFVGVQPAPIRTNGDERA